MTIARYATMYHSFTFDELTAIVVAAGDPISLPDIAKRLPALAERIRQLNHQQAQAICRYVETSRQLLQLPRRATDAHRLR